YTWRWDIPTDRVVVNAAFAHLFDVDPAGATREGLSIEFFINSIHEEDRSHVLAAIEQAIATGEPYRTEYRIHTTTGEERWLTARGQVEYNAAGEPLAFPGALADITERKRAEEDRDRFSDCPRYVGDRNLDGYILQANPAWAETLGYTMPELTAQPYIEFVHPDDQAATLAEAQTLAQGIPTVGFESRYSCRDGSYRGSRGALSPLLSRSCYIALCVILQISDAPDLNCKT
ncbi:PAS domain S-box protein, partial [Nostoc sp. HG1]|nr:PAS domain S-box protein [Nostoc sp. HG1]